ncbi:hypothetical protein D3C86_1711830 [compost metagenome]
MESHELRQRGGQARESEGHGRRDAYRSAQAGRSLGHFGLDGFAGLENARGMLQRKQAAIGQRHAPRRAVKQHDFHAFFQSRDGFRHRGL